MKRDSMNMTRGSIVSNMVFFAIPVFFGHLFQLLYNTFDTLVVGNFIGSNALAAVGSTGTLINTLIGFVNGTCSGAGIIVAKCFGADDRDGVRTAVHTIMAFGLTAGAVMSVVGVTLAPQILDLMGTPSDVMNDAVIYIRTYFYGAIFLVLYNACVGILQAVGDSRHPLYYLIFSSFLNIFLNVLFVTVFNMGVAGVAWATVISQFASASLCLIRLIRTDECYHLSLSRIRFNGDMMRNILRYGFPSGVQNSIVAFSNLLVQTHINSFGAATMAGNSIFDKIHGIIFLPVQCFSIAVSTFVGQNLGAREFDRVKHGVKFSTIGGTLCAIVLGGTAFAIAPQLVGLFTKDPAVLEIGIYKARFISPFLFFAAYTNIIAAVLRGSGKSFVAMIVMISCYSILKVVYLYSVMPFFHSYTMVLVIYPITWFLAGIIMNTIYRKMDLTKTFRTRKVSE